MVFNSYTFFIFLTCALLLHHLPLPWSFKKFNLLIASYLFYAAWNPPFVLLLWLSTVIDWHAAKLISSAKSKVIARVGLLASLFVNLGLLAYFKYGNFVLENYISFANSLGIQHEPPAMNVILPVGISFYTFQTLSYTIDVYRGNAKPWKSFLDFALYVTFFPQLVAGPIVRAVDFLPQCLTPRKAKGNEFAWGINLLLIGLFQKIVVADGLLAPIVERVYTAEATDFVSAWCGTIAFSGQIFCDFAGYSTCAIGVAMCLGFGLPDNFRFPYAAKGFSDFWQRWHISLSTWLRDYIYIPMGGNRCSRTRTLINLLLTMLIGGLWHGAAWTFVIWGGLHGLYLVMERFLKMTSLANWKVWQTLLGELFLIAATYFLICLTWVFFRADSFSQGIEFTEGMFLLKEFRSVRDSYDQLLIGKWDVLVTLLTVGSILLIHFFLRKKTLEEAVYRMPAVCWIMANVAMIVSIIMMPGEDRAFIYFQF